MLPSRQEHKCRAINMSPGGMSLSAPVRPAVGETAVVYLDALGRFSGRVTRHTREGFAMSLDLPLAKRERLADQLTWFANRETLESVAGRRHERFTPIRQHTLLKPADGQEILAKIRDLSVSGVAIESSIQPALGAPITIGNTPMIVVRHFEGGFAAEFDTPFAENEINELTRL
jgi:hypothetical protein